MVYCSSIYTFLSPFSFLFMTLIRVAVPAVAIEVEEAEGVDALERRAVNIDTIK